MNDVSDIIWETSPINLPAKLTSWLLHPGSFIERLEAYGIKEHRVEVLMESWRIPEQSECELLKLNVEIQALIREVTIATGDTIWMYARTVFPRDTIVAEAELADLQNRSLGSVLFKDPNLKRSEFEIACLQPGMKFYNRIQNYIPAKQQKLWMRRSLFKTHGKELMLTEVFFPDIEKLC